MEQQDPRKEPQSSFRGLYRHVKISVKTLDKMIIGGILVIVLLLGYGIANNGYTVTFDSKGGTDVASQQKMYGEFVDEPEPRPGKAMSSPDGIRMRIVCTNGIWKPISSTTASPSMPVGRKKSNGNAQRMLRISFLKV